MPFSSFTLLSYSLLCGPVTLAQEPKPPGELAWARGLAGDFWQASLGSQPTLATALFSPELHREVEKGYKQTGSHWVGATTLEFIGSNFKSSSIRVVSEELAPDKSEVVFKGRLVKEEDPFRLDFTLRVAKEGGGRWSIRFLEFKESPTEKDLKD